MTDETSQPSAAEPLAARRIGALPIFDSALGRLGMALQNGTARAEALETASEMARVGGWAVELPWGQLTWSDQVRAIHDLSPGPASPLEEALACYTPEGRKAIREAFAECARRGEPFDLALPITTATAQRRWVRVMGRAVREAPAGDRGIGGSGRIVRVEGAFQDISDRKEIEENLRLSEERFKYVSRAIADAVWDWDLRTDAIWWNEGLSQLFGVPPAEEGADSTSWAWRIHPADHVRVTDSIYEVINGDGTNWSAEYRFRRQDGSYADVFDRGFVIRDARGEAVRMVGGISDLGDQYLAEEESRLDAETRAGIVKIQQEIAALDLDLSAVMTLTAERARLLTGGTGGLIELLEGDMLVCRASSGSTARKIGVRLPLDQSLSGMAVASGAVLMSADVETDARVNLPVSQSVGAKSIIAAPLRSGTDTIGVLKVMSDQPHAFSERDVMHMEMLVASLGSVIQRHRIAEELRTSEAQYRLLFNNNPMPMWVYETEGWRFLAVNQAAVDHYGYTEAEFLSMGLRDIWPPDDAASIEQLSDAILHNRPQYAVKRRHRKRNGELIDVESSGNGIVFDGKRARLAMANDVSHRLRTERELASVSRAQRMLSACNESLIRATSEAGLLHEICRITVDIGGYAMAWVGHAHDDDAKRITIAARWGTAASELDALPMSWAADTPVGRGPAGRTIRSGQMVLIENIAEDESFRPWVGLAMSKGFHGVVCLPLRNADHTFGLFYLYAPRVLRISADEVRLLEELANDLAFGIGNLRAQEEQRRLQAAVLKVAVGVSASTGSTFFEDLSRNMADALGAEVGMLARLDGADTELDFLSAVVRGQSMPRFRRPLAGMPCQDITERQWLCTDVPAGRYQASPDLGGFVVRGYAGRRLDNSAGRPIGVIGVLFDAPLTRSDFVMSTLQIFAARAAAEMERQEADMRILDQASLLDKAQDAIIVRALDHRIVYWNKSAERLYGWSSEEALGHAVAERTHMDPEAFAQAHAELMAAGEWNGEITQVRKDEATLTVEARWTLVRNAGGEATSVLAINTDITARKAAEREIQKLAFYDPLTQLPNRLLLMDRLQHALAASTRTGRGGALLFIDLDNFKTLNDTLGHDQGDLLLQQVALRLTSCVREADSVARLGGDEFVVMLEELGQNAADVASQAKLVGEKVLAMLGTPYRLAHGEHQSTASIGIAPFAGHHESMGELLKQADIAMYQAKAAGRNTLRFFDPGLQAAVTARASLEADMRHALAHDEFTLHYQPQADHLGHISGVEALIRWNHPTRGPVSPAAFIPLAEETGIILPIGQKVLQMACRLMADWARQPETAGLTMAVNVSSRQFRHPDFVGHVTEVLRASGANPRRLKLELTESLMVDDMDVTVEKMTELQRLGVGFSLDD
ncbi:MAG: sensor-containing diguanylate cyclase/phosphodiesterase, partial [Rhodoferax sp.]|nr:sensor-containing diguanylate cyclase/phosphodiesterase [Rhodoferax sp.]